MSPSIDGLTLGHLAGLCRAEIRGAASELRLTGVASLADAGAGDVAFYTNPSYRRQLASCRAGVVIVAPSDAELPELADRPLLVATTPYAAFARISAAFHPEPAVVPERDPSARIDPTADVHPEARIEAFAYVGPRAHVGAGVVLMVGAYVGADARIGAGSRLYPHAVVRDGCLVGERCILHPGAVVGADGFGFAFDPEGDGAGPMHRKIPQTGIARLEDDVEIGANSCIDRATLGETVIGRGSKIDNLVQIGHNVQVGALSVLASQVGIAGSSRIGVGVAMGGQAGVAGHLEVGDMARLGAKAGVAQDVAPGLTVMGYPAVDARLWRRASVALNRLPDLVREVRQLRQRLLSLDSGRPDSDEPRS